MSGFGPNYALQRVANLQPQQIATLAVTTSSARVATAGLGTDIEFKNIGTAEAFVNVGDGTVAALSNGTQLSIPAGAILVYNFSNAIANVIANTGTVNVAAITASGGTTLRIAQGTGS